MRPGSASGSTRCWGRRPHEIPLVARARVRPESGCRRPADLQVPPLLLPVFLARLPRVRPRARHADDRLASPPLQPLERGRRRLPGDAATVIVASVLSPIENALSWLLAHLHGSV